MHEYLKVKVKSLAVESRIIRQEEIKAKRAYKWNRDHDGNPEKFNRLREGLYEHRVGSLRNESRISHLAYGFLKKVSYKAMENKCGTDPDWDRIARLIKKYGEEDNRILMQKFSAWKEEE